jgi:nucleoside-diphosphate kinase
MAIYPGRRPLVTDRGVRTRLIVVEVKAWLEKGNAMERTLVLIKPDAMQRGLAGEILGRLERRGLRIVGLKLLQVDRALAERHYGEHVGKPFYEGLVSYITACPIIAIALEGTGAVEAVRSTVGKTNPREAAPGTIRGDFGLEIGRNLIHGSDSLQSAERELSLFFKASDLIDYTRDVDRWVFE